MHRPEDSNLPSRLPTRLPSSLPSSLSRSRRPQPRELVEVGQSTSTSAHQVMELSIPTGRGPIITQLPHRHTELLRNHSHRSSNNHFRPLVLNEAKEKASAHAAHRLFSGDFRIFT